MALLIEDKDSPREMSIALERKLAAAPVDPEEHHHHEHGEECGCGHDHSHSHGHDHHNHHHHHDHSDEGRAGGRLAESESPAQSNDEPGHVPGPDCKH
jgi:hypothetical protein